MQQPHTSISPALYGWLQLSRIPGLGSVSLKQLWQTFGSSQAILSAAAQPLSGLNLRRSAVTALLKPAALAADELSDIENWLQQPQHHLLSLDDPAYPEALRQIADPPPLLYLIGDAELLSYPQVALVGSRNASPQGLADARSFGQSLSSAGLVPTSGLALGIDAAAHQGALQGLGLTVAVLGTGLNKIYPARHQALAQQIVDQGGVLLSELPLDMPARAQNFPKRNRIISGLSLGVLVVEAALKSGSLITARLAAEQGREVFALPGSIHNPLSQGCHHLIRQGAILVNSPQQIIEELASQLELRPTSVAASTALPDSATACADSAELKLARSEQQLLQAIGFETVGLDQLVARLQQPVQQLQAGLLSLELQGLVAAAPGGYQRLIQ